MVRLEDLLGNESFQPTKVDVDEETDGNLEAGVQNMIDRVLRVQRKVSELHAQQTQNESLETKSKTLWRRTMTLNEQRENVEMENAALKARVFSMEHILRGQLGAL